MARHRASYEHPGDDDVNEIIGNGSLSEHYLALARDLDVMEAKVFFFFLPAKLLNKKRMRCIHEPPPLPAQPTPHPNPSPHTWVDTLASLSGVAPVCLLSVWRCCWFLLEVSQPNPLGQYK